MRILLLIVPLLLATSTHLSAQEWARKMFAETDHDFGTVARGSKQEFAFEFKNLYEEDIHISGIRSSCGCTSARVTKDTLKTFETSHVIATYNTRSFLGAKSATITVTIDEPFLAEVQLNVSGYIRRDVVFNPGVVAFGAVDAGAGSEKKIQVAYAGRNDWEIVDVRSANRHFEVELAETARGNGRVDYDMLVRLKPDAPVGYIQDQLTIVTNDSNAKTIPLPVEGRVESALSVNPAQLFLGVLQPGQSATKRLVVRGKTPFSIKSVKCEDDCFEFTTPTETTPKTLHFVYVKFTAGQQTGPVNQKIVIETDQAGGVTTCTATATITE